MKLATFYRGRGDYVRFVKGKSPELRAFGWDQVLVTTLFTFEWRRTVDTIRFYMRGPGAPQVIVGGILASLMPQELHAATGARVVQGLLDEEGRLGLPGDEGIDRLIPDYSILEDVDYSYPTCDAYFIHATRGCVNRCEFCAVPIIEPRYRSCPPFKEQAEAIRELYGEKRDLILMDNNTVASPHFDRIIDEILDLGFGRGAMYQRRRRHVDFNQGLDVRLLSRDKMRRLAETAVWPLRMAFDDIRVKDKYVEAVEWAAECGLKRLSNYVLFNYEDTPEDFYERLRINVEMNDVLKTNIYSFPMRFSPVNRTDRGYIGPHWNWRYIRGVQCILNATRGVVGIKKEYFLRAFGKSSEEFLRLITMPEEYILHREEHEGDSALEWTQQYVSLSPRAQEDFHRRVLHGREADFGSDLPEVEALLAHY